MLPKMRTPVDRVRQVVLFEIGGLLIITPPFIWLTGVEVFDSLALLALIALLAALWNALYNTCFDWIEGRLTGRRADQRPALLRVLQALGFEAGLLLMSLPLVIVWTGMGWLDALTADIGLALAYVLYAYVFNLAYDRVFPIPETT